MVTVGDICGFMDTVAPFYMQFDFDNIGLMLGDPTRPVTRVLTALDATEAVVAEAVGWGAELIVTHHPLIFHPLRHLSADEPQGKKLMDLIRADISVLSFHTNLDAAEGGVNDLLARLLGVERAEPFNEEKIGRVGTLKCEKSLEQFLQDVVHFLGCRGLRYRDAGKPVRRVAVGGGACAEFIPQVLALGCDTFVTSDVKYHDFLDANGLNLIDAGHFETENPVCEAVRAYLAERFPQLELVRSTSHAESVIQYYMK